MRVLDCGVPAQPHDYQATPSFRLETFERKDTLVPDAPASTLAGARSFGLDRRLVIASRSAAPNFKILLWPFRAGEPPPETVWDDARTKLTVSAGTSTDTITFQPGTGGRTQVELSRPGEPAVTVK